MPGIEPRLVPGQANTLSMCHHSDPHQLFLTQVYQSVEEVMMKSYLIFSMFNWNVSPLITIHDFHPWNIALKVRGLLP